MQELNNVEELTPLIITANTAEFKNKLITPVNHEVFIACLKLALQHNAREIIEILSRCELSSRDEKRKSTKLIDLNAKTLLHLVSIEYAEMFHTQKKMQQLFLNMISNVKNKNVILAAIMGETSYLRTIDAIPQLPPQFYHPVIVYAAANNQLDVVRYLHAQKENPHELDYHRSALVAAITCNASDVFDYLITTEFDPNLSLSIDTRWPCKLSEDPTTHKLLTLSVVCNHPDQFIKLVKKGAIISETIFNVAVKSGCVPIVLYCIENAPKLINSSLMLAATQAAQLTTLQILCDKTSILDTQPNTLQICLEAAIKYGHVLMVRFLVSRNIAIDHVGKTGLSPLFYAVKHNKIDAVKELVAHKADILAVDERGENALLIACQSSEHLEILEYLLSIEKIAETLNSEIYNNKNLLTVLWTDYSISYQVLERLVKHGIALFRSIPIENSQERYFVFTYQDMDYKNFENLLPQNHRSICVFYLNYFAAKQLLQMKEITLEYQMVANYLLKYFQKSTSLYLTNISSHLLNFRPDFLALQACTKNLHALSNFKKEIQSNTELTPSRLDFTLWFLCQAISTNCDNTCRVLSTFLSSPIELSKLRLMVNTIASIPKGDIKDRLCIALADRIIALTQNLNLEIITAIELYKTGNEDKNAAIQEKINSCIQTLCQLNREPDYNRILQENLGHLNLMQPTEKLQYSTKIYLIRAAIRNNNIEILTYLESNGYLLLIKPVKSTLIAIQIAKSKIVFKYLEEKTTKLLTEKTPELTDLPIIKLLITTIQESNHTTSQESEQNLLLLKTRQQYLLEMEKFLALEQSNNNSDMCIQFLKFPFPVVRDKINELHAKNNVNLTSNTLFNKLNLCLLLSKNPQDKILELLSHLLNKLTGNITRRLLILSHICTYHNSAIKNPEQSKIILIRALAQLANIEFSEKDSLETLTLKQPKKLLIAILIIHLELVKLLTNEYGELEKYIYQLSNATSDDFLSIYHSCMQTISKVIHEHLTLQDLSISTFYLDSIAQGCMVYLTRPIRDLVEEDYSANELGKRAANKDIPNSTSPKRNI